MIDKPVKGRAVIIGQIEVVEIDGDNYKTDLGMLIVFDTAEDVRKAISDRKLELVIFGESSD